MAGEILSCTMLGLRGLLAGEAVSFDLVVEGGRPQARNAWDSAGNILQPRACDVLRA